MANLTTTSTPSTPPPTSEIHTPATPRFGYADDWQPYSPRKSARLSHRANNNTSNRRTPSPRPSARDRNVSLGSPRTKRNHPSIISDSMTPQTSPRKKRMPTMESNRRISGSLTAESTASAAAALGINGKKTTETRVAGMLPTPAKTPQKPPSEKSKADIKAIARNLFQHDEAVVMPSPRKGRGKKHILDSFDDNDVEESIPIFTDSRERIPEVDLGLENPFNGPPVAPARPSRFTKPTKREYVHIPGEGKVPIEQAVGREDGMVIVFRGKRQFRKFAEHENVSPCKSRGLDVGDGGLDHAVESARRPMTRSAYKPRVLFPAHPKRKANLEEEEADTDIEDHIQAQASKDNTDVSRVQTPEVDKTPDTPVAPRFAPASPPTTQRTTRHGTKSAQETTPIKPIRGSKGSPFDRWRRTKNGDPEGCLGHKRSGESLTADDVKRTRA